ncbi:flap endonuclease 1-like [Brassica napus]|uniref:flap endonuclease 1-like n=1 Tax=Brassica napus TaxID=3708 RepID=UPI002078C9F0|nr:flap endonuclease 1-like [Brassica napus]
MSRSRWAVFFFKKRLIDPNLEWGLIRKSDSGQRDACIVVGRTGTEMLTNEAGEVTSHLQGMFNGTVRLLEAGIKPVRADATADLTGAIEFKKFIDLCILSGCDYCDSIRGIGGQTALKLIRQHGSIETILENINKERYQIPEEWPYNEARKLFKEPDVLTDEEQLDIKWTSPDEEGIVQFLVNENGFNIDRVTKAVEKIKSAKNKSSQGRLESFFKPVAN